MKDGMLKTSDKVKHLKHDTNRRVIAFFSRQKNKSVIRVKMFARTLGHAGQRHLDNMSWQNSRRQIFMTFLYTSPELLCGDIKTHCITDLSNTIIVNVTTRIKTDSSILMTFNDLFENSKN